MESKINDDKILKKYKKIDLTLIICTYMMLAIPIAMLLIFWFKWYISVPCFFCLTIALILVIRKIKYKTLDEYKQIFNIKKIAIIMLGLLIFNILSGAGGLFYQNWDYRYRNTVLHDLIDKDWPVKYDYSSMEYEKAQIGTEKGFLSYYFTYWLPGATVGKLLGFEAANMFLLLWQFLGTTLFFYLVYRKMNKVKIRYFLVFICFGGLDIITKFIINMWSGQGGEILGATHIDTANGMFCMSTFVTQLFWVFNQSLPAWLITMLLVNDKSYENLGLMIALLLPFAPFPCLGLILICILFIIFGFDFNNTINFERIKKLFSIQNIIGVISVIPIGLMFLQNENEKGSVFIKAYNNGNLLNILIGYLLFVILEFGIYSIIINKENKKRILAYFALFAIVPAFYLGKGLDLGNRATIPILILLYLEIIKFIDNKNSSKIRVAILCVILAIAFCTNFNEFYRSITYTMENWRNNKFISFNDTYITFNQFENKECEKLIKNFVSPDKDNYFSKILR